MNEEAGLFALGTFSSDGEAAFPGLVVGQSVLDLRPHLGATTSTQDLLADWDITFGRLSELAAGDLSAAASLERLRPLPSVQPSQVFCAGANYFKHMQEFFRGRIPPDETRSEDELQAQANEELRKRVESGKPFMYSAPVSALCGARDDVVLWGPGVEHDWELELAVVIGRPARDVSVRDAMGFVAGYTISNDVSTRDVMFRQDLPLTDFVMSKGRSTFFPTGPYVVPRQFIPDYRALQITLKVNGEVMQDESTSDMIYGVEQMLAYASSVTDLRPGDLLLTGSPAGNAGHHGNRWLRPGDVMDGTISGLGFQSNRCVADPRDASTAAK